MILQHEKHRTLLFAGLQSPYAQHILRQHTEFAEVDSVLWVDLDDSHAPQRILAKSSAALCLCSYLGGWWQLLRFAWIVAHPIRDWLYDIIARNRHRLMAASVCRLPRPEDNVRFRHDAPN